MSERSININKILYDAVMNNKLIFLTIIILLVAFYLQDTMFSRAVANITRDIPGFAKNVDIDKLKKAVFPFVGAIVLFFFANYISSNKIPKIEVDVAHELTNQIVESVKTTKKKINVNEIMNQMNKVLDIRNLYKIITSSYIPAIVVTVSLLYNFFKADTRTGFYIFLIIIILILVTIKLEYDNIALAQEAEKASNELQDDIHEVMTNIDSVVTSDTKNKELKNIDVSKDKTHMAVYASYFKNGNTTYLLEILSLIAVLGINYMSYKLYIKTVINETTLITIVLLTLLFMDYYNYCVSATKEAMNNIGKLSDAHEYFSTFKIKQQTKEIESIKKELKIKRGDIDFENITLKHNDKTVFDNMNLHINGNAKIGITGPIGCGKSTLLKILAGISDYNGNIYIDGQKLKDCTYESLTQHIAYISQHPKLFNKSILYNISYGTKYNRKEIIEKLDKLGLIEFINMFPNGLDTNVGKEGTNVSGGQKQFISFIRALMQDKSIILLDEPSSSLDQKSKEILMNLLQKLSHKTIIVTTHDKELLPLFNDIIDNPAGKKKELAFIKPYL